MSSAERRKAVVIASTRSFTVGAFDVDAHESSTWRIVRFLKTKGGRAVVSSARSAGRPWGSCRRKAWTRWTRLMEVVWRVPLFFFTKIVRDDFWTLAAARQHLHCVFLAFRERTVRRSGANERHAVW